MPLPRVMKTPFSPAGRWKSVTETRTGVELTGRNPDEWRKKGRGNREKPGKGDGKPRKPLKNVENNCLQNCQPGNILIALIHHAWKEFSKPSGKPGGFSFFGGADSPANRVPIPPACGPWLPEKPFLGGSNRSARPESRRNLAQRAIEPRLFHHGGVFGEKPGWRGSCRHSG